MNSLFKNILKPLISIYLFSFGLGWITIHIYLRFFVERPTYLLSDLKLIIDTKHILFTLLFGLLHLVIIVIILRTFYKQYYNIKPESKIIQHIVNAFNHVYWKPLEYLHERIAPHLPYSGVFFMKISKFLNKNSLYLYYLIVILLDFFPRLLISLIFFVEVIFFNKIYYFVHSLYLFSIPLLFSLFLKLYYSLAVRNRPLVEQVVKVTPLGSPKYDQNLKRLIYNYNFELRKEYEGVEDLKETVNYWWSFFQIYCDAVFMKEFLHKYQPYVILVSSSLFASATLFKLVYLLS